MVAVLIAVPAFASGPVYPDGWGDPKSLDPGQPCCIPADLNGTGLVGGAFVVESNDHKSYAVFALTYSRDEREQWHRLVSGPVSDVRGLRVSILDAGEGKLPFGGVVVCSARRSCRLYWLDKGARRFGSREHVAPAR